MNRISKFRGSPYLLFLVIALLFVACAANDGLGESIVTTTPTVTPEVTMEQATPVPTKVENSDEVNVIPLVEDKVRERGRYSESVSVEVEEETSIVSLPGVSFYVATPMVVDSLDDHCVVLGEEVWCSQEALQKIIEKFSLGTDPEQLSDDEWLALITFFTYTTPLNNPDDLGSDAAKLIPDSEQEKISEPSIRRLESGGIEISFYFTVGDIMGFGDMALNILEFSVAEENVMRLEHHEIWNNFDREE